MHAMVRYNLLHDSELWDPAVYGVPIPQVDQMGAALLTSFRLAQLALERGGYFSPAMRDLIELLNAGPAPVLCRTMPALPSIPPVPTP